MYTYDWFMLRFDRRQQTSVKQVHFKKNRKSKRIMKWSWKEGRIVATTQFGKGNKHTPKFQEINKNNALLKVSWLSCLLVLFLNVSLYNKTKKFNIYYHVQLEKC